MHTSFLDTLILSYEKGSNILLVVQQRNVVSFKNQENYEEKSSGKSTWREKLGLAGNFLSFWKTFLQGK